MKKKHSEVRRNVELNFRCSYCNYPLTMKHMIKMTPIKILFKCPNCNKIKTVIN